MDVVVISSLRSNVLVTSLNHSIKSNLRTKQQQFKYMKFHRYNGSSSVNRRKVKEKRTSVSLNLST